MEDSKIEIKVEKESEKHYFIFNLEDNFLIQNPILSLKKLKYPTWIKNFNSIDLSVNNSILFKTIFQQIYSFISTFNNSKELREELDKIEKNTDFNKNLSKILDQKIEEELIAQLPELEKELEPLLGVEWNRLNVYFNGRTKIHILFTLVLINLDLTSCIEIKFSEYDTNILLWAILLHDIAKHVVLNPQLDEEIIVHERSVDKIHPFKSGATALNIFYRNNFICFNDNLNTKEKIEEIYDMLISSAELTEFNNKKRHVHSHKFLSEIIEGFKLLRQTSQSNNWIIDVIILVTFHQSLPNNKKHMNFPILEDEYIISLFDQRLLELMRILMVNDSASHSRFSNESYAVEINDNIDLLRDKFFFKSKF